MLCAEIDRINALPEIYVVLRISTFSSMLYVLFTKSQNRGVAHILANVASVVELMPCSTPEGHIAASGLSGPHFDTPDANSISMISSRYHSNLQMCICSAAAVKTPVTVSRKGACFGIRLLYGGLTCGCSRTNDWLM